jgi:hypothetical protein
MILKIKKASNTVMILKIKNLKHCYDPKDKKVYRNSTKKYRRLLQEQIRHIFQGFN